MFSPEDAPFFAMDIANYLARKGLKEKVIVDPLKLVNLVYISHGFFLAIKEKPLINELVQAWHYGPVIPSVYFAFRIFHPRTNCKPVGSYAKIDDTVKKPSDISKDPAFQAEAKKIIDEKVWPLYKDKTGIELFNLTHRKNTPWDRVWNDEKGCDKLTSIIPNQYIYQYYKALIKHLQTKPQ